MPQSEVNIGLVGHVDHGKCIAEDETLLLNCSLVSGTDLIRRAEESGVVINRSQGELTYELPGLYTYSLGPDMSLHRVKPYLFVQDYKGKLITLRTRSGREITVTPQHPFLANRRGKLEWVEARNLTKADFISILGRFDVPPSTGLNEDFLNELTAGYFVLDYNEYKRLKLATDNFKAFDLPVQDLNKIRLLTGLSHRAIAKAVGCSPENINSIFSSRTPLNSEMRKRLSRLFAESEFKSLRQGEFILGDLNKSRYVYRLKDVPLDEDMVKWFAFLHAEGTSNSNRIIVAQKTHMQLLAKFFRISKRKFGLEFSKIGEITYRASSKPVVSYLRAKFGFSTGASRESPICPWAPGLPKELKSAFLRWFFTLEAESNKSGEIILMQANKKSINTIAFMLLSFGIIPKLGRSVKYATNTKDKTRRTYYRLTISGRRDLRKFLEMIGFEDARKERVIREYLGSVRSRSKSDNFVVPLSFSELSEFLDVIGFKRGKLESDKIPDLKDRPWLKSYEDCRYTNAMSIEKFSGMLSDAEEHLILLRESSANLNSLDTAARAMELFGISDQELSKVVHLSQTEVSRILRGSRKHHRSDPPLIGGVKEICCSRLRYAEEKLAQWRPLNSGTIVFDPITDISAVDYDGRLVDLSVPGYANFVAGFGSVISHNTTLTKSLSGVWTDRHSEEIRRGISIRLGYADTSVYKCEKCVGFDGYTTKDKCPKCGGKAKLMRKISFVDAPGHETLIATMLSGSALMDGVILVIAADEPCPQPQTKEHLLALKLMDLDKIIVVQNKVDVVEKEQALKNRQEIEAFLKTVGMTAPIIPIAANYNANVDVVIAAIQELIPTPKRDLTKQPKMFIARSFDVNKPGSKIKDMKGGVVGGSLMQGELKKGDMVEIKPGIKRIRQNQEVWETIKTRIIEIDEGGEILDKALPGGLIAIQTQLDPFLTKSDALSGNVLGKVGTLPAAISSVESKVHLIERELINTAVEIKPGEPLMVSIGTTVTVGIVQKQKGDQMSLNLKLPIVAEKGDKFALSKRIDMKWRLIGYGVIV